MSSLDQQIADDLSHIDGDRRANVSVRDILHVFRTLEELNAVLHRTELGPIESFDKWRSTVYPFLREAYYKRCWEMLPEDVQRSIEQRG